MSTTPHTLNPNPGGQIMPRVLVINEISRDAETPSSDLLCGHGLEVKVVNGEFQAVTLARKESFDLVVLDVPQCEADVCDGCRFLRANIDAPMLFLSEAPLECEEIDAFAAGADDYVAAPFDSRVFLARVDALLRRARKNPGGGQALVSSFNIVIDVAARRVSIDGREVQLTRVEFGILVRLAQTPDWIVGRPDILTSVWGDSYHDDHIVQVNISRLRSKLIRSGADRRFLSTHRGLGYRLNSTSLGDIVPVGESMQPVELARPRQNLAVDGSEPWGDDHVGASIEPEHQLGLHQSMS
ncbi:MAG: response regulator transcription factor [Actinomycetes bacterium]